MREACVVSGEVGSRSCQGAGRGADGMGDGERGALRSTVGSGYGPCCCPGKGPTWWFPGSRRLVPYDGGTAAST